MASVLYNPTGKLDKKFQEIFKGQYLGKGMRVEPGQKLKVPDATARHLLNELSPRGLMSLDFGDEDKIDEITKEGLERNRTFKVKQLNDFNEKNSARKHMGLPYLWPSKFLKLYAEEIGVKLVESYQVDDAQLQKVKGLEEENKALRDQMSDMNEKMNQILNYMPKPAGPDTRFGSVEDPVPNVDGTTPLTKDGVPDKRFKGE